jgi:hypothetical protein
MVASSPIIEASPATLLHWARRREEAGDLIGSGVCLRAGIYRQLLAMAAVRRCLLRSPGTQKSPRRLAEILLKAGVITDGDYQWVCEAIDAGNCAAHVRTVDRAKLKGGLVVLGMMIDEWPNGEHVEKAESMGGAT